LGWPYGEVPVIVLTNRNLKTDKKNVQFHSEELSTLVNSQLKPRYQSIWMVGGAQLAREFLRMDLADELIVSTMPIILGDGIPFFDNIGSEFPLHLVDVTAYEDGMVETTYEIKKDL